MARCPKCEQEQLVATTVTSGLRALGCSSCGGVLLSLVRYLAWREAQDIETLAAEAGDQNASSSSKNKTACFCAKCQALIGEYRCTSSRDSQLDFCGHCQEVWFEQKAWALLNRLSFTKEITQIFTHPRQHSLPVGEIEKLSEACWKPVHWRKLRKALAARLCISSPLQRSELLA